MEWMETFREMREEHSKKVWEGFNERLKLMRADYNEQIDLLKRAKKDHSKTILELHSQIQSLKCNVEALQDQITSKDRIISDLVMRLFAYEQGGNEGKSESQNTDSSGSISKVLDFESFILA